MSRPIRFTFILFLAALGTALAAVGGWRYARASAPVSGPIILISIDTLRADHLPAYGYTHVKTPAIDALAADGVVFERAYSHAPQTLPAHAALLSGRLPFENGVRDNVGFSRQARRAAAAADAARSRLRHRRRRLGVRAAQGHRHRPGVRLLRRRHAAGSLGAVDRAGAARRRRIGKDCRALARSIGTRRAPSCSCISTSRTSRTTPPDRFAEFAPYDGEIAYADEIVGRLVKYLKSHQLYDRSTIVLLSDHGEGLGDHGEQEHGLFVYDEAIHVPLIIKQESNASAGRRVADVVQHIDLVPTILDLVKAPLPWGPARPSLKPLLEGTGRPAPVSVYSESLYGRAHFGWSAITALTSDRTPAPVLAEPIEDAAKKSEIVNSYRRAVALAADSRWREAIPILQAILRQDVEMAEVWRLLGTVAARIDRYDDVLNASWYWIGLKPEDPNAYLAAAAALVKLKRAGRGTRTGGGGADGGV